MLRARLAGGASVADAIWPPPVQRSATRPGGRAPRVYAVGSEMLTLSEMARRSGMLTRTLAYRMAAGATPEQAMRPEHAASRRVLLNGVERTLRELASMTGVRAPTIQKRLATGWSVEEACGLVTRDRPDVVRMIVDGEALTRREAAARYGVPLKTLEKRLERGQPPEVACKRPVQRVR